MTDDTETGPGFIPELVYTQDRSSRRIHAQYRAQSGKLFRQEGCNLDDAGAYDEVDEATVQSIAEREPDLLCRNDFPQGQALP